MRRGLLLTGMLLAGLAALSPDEAHAQEAETNAVTGTAKGIVGGGLLGAEIVMLPMGIAGLKPWWPYVVFGGVGAVGGAVGGWAIEQELPPAEAPLYMLAGGLALIIPTLVLTLNATTRTEYEDEQDPSTLTKQPEDPLNTPIPGEGTTPGTPGVEVDGGAGVTPGATVRTPRKRAGARPALPLALFDLAGEDIRMGIPNVAVKPLYTQAELYSFDLDQGTTVDIPLFRTAF